MGLESQIKRLRDDRHLELVRLAMVRQAAQVLEEDTSGQGAAQTERRRELARRVIAGGNAARQTTESMAELLVAQRASVEPIGQLLASVAATWDACAGVSAADRA